MKRRLPFHDDKEIFFDYFSSKTLWKLQIFSMLPLIGD